MSTKTTKRKRASAPTSDAAAPAPAPAPAPAQEAAETGMPAMPTIGLSSNSTVKDAADLKDALLKVLDEPASVTIDTRSVERIDTAIMQLLCAFVRDRAERNLAVTWSATPQPFVDAVRLLGVGSMLALPANA
jgi:ABC-type transporter Mla MlaB component